MVVAQLDLINTLASQVGEWDFLNQWWSNSEVNFGKNQMISPTETILLHRDPYKIIITVNHLETFDNWQLKESWCLVAPGAWSSNTITISRHGVTEMKRTAWQLTVSETTAAVEAAKCKHSGLACHILCNIALP